jgi:hypothetical protein
MGPHFGIFGVTRFVSDNRELIRTVYLFWIAGKWLQLVVSEVCSRLLQLQLTAKHHRRLAQYFLRSCALFKFVASNES